MTASLSLEFPLAWRWLVKRKAVGFRLFPAPQPIPPSLVGAFLTFLQSHFPAFLPAFLPTFFPAFLQSHFPASGLMFFDYWLGKAVRYDVIKRHD